MITVNGKQVDIRESATLLEMLEVQGYRLDVIAVEYNGAIIKKEDYAHTTLMDGDKVEVVSFVGGG